MSPAGVGRGQHRQPGREAVATCAGNPGADARDAREDSLQQERVGQRGAVAILRTDRLGEPVQLAAATARPFDPGPVMPTDGCVTEGVVVLHGARRPGSAMRSDVDLLGHVQLAPQVIDEQSRQSRAHRRSDDEHGTVAPGVIVETDKGMDVGNVGRHGNDRDAGRQVVRRQLGVGMRLAESHHIGDAEVGGATDPNGPTRCARHCWIEDRHVGSLAQQEGAEPPAGDSISDHTDNWRCRRWQLALPGLGAS